LIGAAAIPTAVAVSALAAVEPVPQILVPEVNKDAKLIELGQGLEQAAAGAEAYRKGPLQRADRLYDKLSPPRRKSPFTVMPRKIAKTVPENPKCKRIAIEQRKLAIQLGS
jgi:hypothetical protein